MRVAITGGTGTLGRALIPRLLASGAERVVSVSRDEVKADDLVAANYDHPNLRVFLGDIRDRDRLVDAFAGCDVVIHAAALKRVTGSSGYSSNEMVKTNVFGTMNVIDAACDVDVERVLFISSDKAVHATNLYGSTKFTGECMAVSANAYTYPQGTRVSCTRYGNVLGSRGSVLEVWSAAVAAGKPIPLTDPRMTRFMMTQAQAVDFVLAAIEAMQGGEIFVPKLPAARLVDLAEAISPGGPTKLIGLRPGGEKLHEQLVSDEEAFRVRSWGEHYYIVPMTRPWTTEPYLGLPWVLNDYVSDRVDLMSVDALRGLL